MPGIRDIAERAGVSISTVSNVLHHKNSASEETREKIFAIAEELGYEIPAAKEKGVRTILFNLSDFDTLYYLEILHGISDYAYAKGYSFLISTGENFPHFSEPEKVCGCIVNDVNTPSDVLKKIADKGIPMIVLDRELVAPRLEGVVDVAVDHHVLGQVVVADPLVLVCAEAAGDVAFEGLHPPGEGLLGPGGGLAGVGALAERQQDAQEDHGRCHQSPDKVLLYAVLPPVHS